jgi:hypothetical protein
MKKTGGKKSCDTVPLNGHHFKKNCMYEYLRLKANENIFLLCTSLVFEEKKIHFVDVWDEL